MCLATKRSLHSSGQKTNEDSQMLRTVCKTDSPSLAFQFYHPMQAFSSGQISAAHCEPQLLRRRWSCSTSCSKLGWLLPQEAANTHKSQDSSEFVLPGRLATRSK